MIRVGGADVYASWRRRLGAWLLDGLLLQGLSIPLALAFAALVVFSGMGIDQAVPLELFIWLLGSGRTSPWATAAGPVRRSANALWGSPYATAASGASATRAPSPAGSSAWSSGFSSCAVCSTAFRRSG